MESHVEIAAGDARLEGLISLPAATPRVGVVLCHPHPLYGGDMDNTVVATLSGALQAAGCATLRFNFRGVGASTGQHDGGLAESGDVVAAIGCLLARASPAIVAVAGYSFGAWVGLRAGAGDARVHQLVGVALPIGRRDASFLSGVVKPKLLVCGDGDDYAPLSELRPFVAALPEPASLAVIAGGDHFLAGHESRVATAVVDFLTR